MIGKKRQILRRFRKKQWALDVRWREMADCYRGSVRATGTHARRHTTIDEWVTLSDLEWPWMTLNLCYSSLDAAQSRKDYHLHKRYFIFEPFLLNISFLFFFFITLSVFFGSIQHIKLANRQILGEENIVYGIISSRVTNNIDVSVCNASLSNSQSECQRYTTRD